jgi:hypothetical protein
MRKLLFLLACLSMAGAALAQTPPPFIFPWTYGGGTCYPFVDQSSCASFTTLNKICINSSGQLCLGSGSACVSTASACITGSTGPALASVLLESAGYLLLESGGYINLEH